MEAAMQTDTFTPNPKINPKINPKSKPIHPIA